MDGLDPSGMDRPSSSTESVCKKAPLQSFLTAIKGGVKLKKAKPMKRKKNVSMKR